MAHKPRGVSCT